MSWMARACGRRLTTPERLGAALAERPRARWGRELLAALTDVDSGCHSLLELRYLRDVERAHGLPPGQRQAVRQRSGGRWYDDVYYARFHTRVELDGRVAHPDESRWHDARRDNAAAVHGDMVLRYGWVDVVERPCRTAAEVAATLVRSGWIGRPTLCASACAIAS
jgi:very-short-patch-repair endonuclease